jgi:ATP-dependent RNA helicase SUPV3L1/SUV3
MAFSLSSGGRVRAVLGPTNTGKTHYAIERMLAHDSGIIGFPLRLLARENYDRLVAAKGASRVALITGEEKIAPPDAHWFACTVEAMPLDRRVAMVAVDEIQLCSDPDRGHVFTDRLLNARGLHETLFLGADTIAPLLRRLVPGIDIQARPRLSTLTHAGPMRLTRLPPRTAVVAFSAAEVYALAELVRRRLGGCALVMGRLSPRTRNAQVALFQNKEVDFVIATDAIGLGLNMDVAHVAFASLVKFDGTRQRSLAAPEIAQIAGRAGRGNRDGTFGTLTGGDPLPPAVIEQVENHRFDPLDRLWWRNGALRFSSLSALLQSLNEPASDPALQRTPAARDHQTLLAMLRDNAVAALAAEARHLQTLWETACIPDFQKVDPDIHARFCGRIFQHLAQHPHTVPKAWIARSIAELDRLEGDIDTLMQRLTGVRLWAYLTARPDWVDDHIHWQAECRVLEDRLSDALHDRLTARFVDRRTAHLVARFAAEPSARTVEATPGGLVSIDGHAVGRLHGFRFAPDPQAKDADRRTIRRSARALLRGEVTARLAAMERSEDTRLRLVETAVVAWREAPAGDTWVPVARLGRGPSVTRPQIVPLTSDLLTPSDLARVVARVQRWLDAQIGRLCAPIDRALATAADSALLRGPAHQLHEALGILPAGSLMVRSKAARSALRRIGMRLSRLAIYHPAMLKPHAMLLRAHLIAVAESLSVPTLPPPGTVTGRSLLELPTLDWLKFGWVAAGPHLVRLDIADRVASALTRTLSAAGTPVPVPPDIVTRLGCRAADLPGILQQLGFVVTTSETGLLYTAQPSARPPRVRPASRRPQQASHPAFQPLARLIRS